jgi:hypothetical protein
VMQTMTKRMDLCVVTHRLERLRNWPAKAAAICHPAAAELVSECLRLIDQHPAQLTLPLVSADVRSVPYAVAALA